MQGVSSVEDTLFCLHDKISEAGYETQTISHVISRLDDGLRN